MPATYSHRRTYEQITGGRNAWKIPRTEELVTPRLFGIDVDSSTFRKYNHQNYTIGYGFYDLAAVERWATDPDRMAKFPDQAAEAKQIMERIIAEITGKDMNTMKTPRTAADFIDALKDIYNESRNAYAVLQDKVDKAAAKVEHAREELRDPSCKEKQMAQLRLEIAQSEYKIAENDRRVGYWAMLTDHEKKIAELRDQFSAYLDEHYSASPDKLDAATMQLLDSGICTPVELSRLVERHQSNPTMLRIVGQYARKLREDNRHNMSRENQIICSNVANVCFSAKDGSRELQIFDEAVATMSYGLDKEAAHAARMHNHVVGWMDDYKNQIVNLPVTPADIAEESNNE